MSNWANRATYYDIKGDKVSVSGLFRYGALEVGWNNEASVRLYREGDQLIAEFEGTETPIAMLDSDNEDNHS